MAYASSSVSSMCITGAYQRPGCVAAKRRLVTTTSAGTTGKTSSALASRLGPVESTWIANTPTEPASAGLATSGAREGDPDAAGNLGLWRQHRLRPTSWSPYPLAAAFDGAHRTRSAVGLTLVCRAQSGGDAAGSEGAESAASGDVAVQDAYITKLPDKNAALYRHSLPAIESWLRGLKFEQTDEDDPARWTVRRPDWHAELSLEATELVIRYLKSGPGSLSRDVERKFSYALSRKDLENAILGGP
ncbi:hypothetical protein CBR_g9073 [Chara braunii]|uniref:Uncharacterized protein n=1 Tax=Chara braunii TaxID=69332 RepID=A0A388KNS9_CHABU|nr:hypothetical protein CBR_g9073 [Chara braunii]|eukprot:GBG71658.1 hypothetical protein CBR_g9073 [Chara braunii]